MPLTTVQLAGAPVAASLRTALRNVGHLRSFAADAQIVRQRPAFGCDGALATAQAMNEVKMPSKRSRAREETTLKSQDLKGFLEEFQKESDRATALLGAALLDEKLLQLLTTFLVDDRKEVDRLLDVEQPLGSFGARIRMAYCLGLTTRSLFDTLTIIKAIRNAFAHQLHGLSFATPDIAKECDKLVPKGLHSVLSSPRAAFLSATLSTQMELWAMKESIEASERRCRVPEWTTLVAWSSGSHEQ